MSNAFGFVYIFTNPCLEGWVKIGQTKRDDIQKRLDELNTPPNLPLSFRAYAYYRVQDPDKVEKSIHRIIDSVDDSRHAREIQASGRIREREFFQMSPEKAYTIMKEVAALRGDSDNLQLLQATPEEQAEEEVVVRRKNFTFEMLSIPVGSILSFINDDSITCEVLDSKNKVTYEGTTYTLSSLASKVLTEKYGWSQNVSVAGPRYFNYENETLSDRRMRLENEIDNNI